MKPEDTIEFLRRYHERHGDLFKLEEVDGTYIISVDRAEGRARIVLTPKDTNLLVHRVEDLRDVTRGRFEGNYSPQESLTFALDLIERTRAERRRG
jgi:hypothetical protein